MTSINRLLESYNWREAFAFAGFRTDQIAEIIKTDEGQNDGESWLAVGRLSNGTYFFLSAWCDYTGWGCQAGGDSEEAATLDDLIRWRMTDADRARLGYTLPPETDGAPLEVEKE